MFSGDTPVIPPMCANDPCGQAPQASLFRVAEVLRDLTLLKLEKELSFGERKMLDTAKNLLVKELSLVNNKEEDEIEAQLQELLGLEEQIRVS